MASQKKKKKKKKQSLEKVYNGGGKRTKFLQANHYTQINYDLQFLQIHQNQGGALT